MNTNLRKAELPELVQELQKQTLLKKDFVVPSKCLSMHNGKLIVMNNANSEGLKKILTELNIGFSSNVTSIEIDSMSLDPIGIFHNQLAEKLNIHKNYYNKMNVTEHYSILDENVTYWLKQNKGNVLLRCFVDKEEKRGVVRAFLSDRFKVIDNYDILLAVLAAVKETGMKIEIDPKGCDVSDTRMYVRFICPEIEIKAPELLKQYRKPDGSGYQNDSIISGFVITNSEVGQGSLSISPRAKILACTNGLISTNEKFSQVHLGGKLEEYSTIQWSEITKQKNLELIISQVKDYVLKFSSAEYLGSAIAKAIEKNRELNHPSDAVVNFCNKLSVSEEKQKDILSYFMKGGDTTSFGLCQAVTYFAHDKANSDEQYELELAAMEIVNNVDVYDVPVAKKTTKEQAILN